MFQGVQDKICADDGGTLQAIGTITYRHVCPVEVSVIYVPSLRTLPRDQSHAPLRAESCGGGSYLSHEVVP